MSIKYQSGAGQIFICNFSGLVDSEMSKIRPVVAFTAPTVQSRASKLCHVIPLSTTPPNNIKNYHLLLKGLDIPGYFKSECWAKCDMIYTVSYSRLNAPFLGKNPSGSRRYVPIFVSKEQLLGIRSCILSALQFPTTTFLSYEITL